MMPIFDYRCMTNHCAHEDRDVLVRTTDVDAIRTCTRCGGPMARVPAAPAMVELDAATGGRHTLHRARTGRI